MKKDNKLNQENCNSKLILEEIKKLEIKYSDFKEYFNDNFYEYVKNNLISLCSDDSNKNLQLGMKLDNLTLKYLCDLARDGNVDVVILLVDRFLSTLRTIKSLSKIKTNTKINDEDILINAIENYYGDKMFSLHLGSCYREMFKEQKEDFFDRVKRYSTNCINIKTILDDIIRILDIYEIVPESEADLKKFIYLKYGYYNNYYFNLEEISAILEVDMPKVVNLYKKSLMLAKDISDSYIIDANYKVNKK